MIKGLLGSTVESKYVPVNHIKSWLRGELYAVNNDSLLSAKMLSIFQWQHEKHFANFFVGPVLISISSSLSNNIKAKNEQKKKRIMNKHLHRFTEIQDILA